MLKKCSLFIFVKNRGQKQKYILFVIILCPLLGGLADTNKLQNRIFESTVICNVRKKTQHP